MKLLVIEDDEAIARKLNHELRRAGHAPTWKGCVAEGLVALRSGRHEMVLPDGSGFDIIAEARRGCCVAATSMGSKGLDLTS